MHPLQFCCFVCGPAMNWKVPKQGISPKKEHVFVIARIFSNLSLFPTNRAN